MEDVLEVYQRPYNPNLPQICRDEQPVQLIKEPRTPLPLEPGKPERYDYEYERNGTTNIFMFSQPLDRVAESLGQGAENRDRLGGRNPHLAGRRLSPVRKNRPRL